MDEDMMDGETPESFVIRVAHHKAEDVAGRILSEKCDDVVVLAADTAVVFNGTIIGKPKSQSQASQILRLLRGNQHLVYTGLVMIALPSGVRVEDVCITKVKMRQYTDREIEAYVASGDPMDKAGAYAVQNRQFLPVEAIEGCLTNVMGLPLCRLVLLMKRLGMEVPGLHDYPCLYLDQIRCSFTVDQL